MRIVGICGSPRKGNSEFMLKTVLDSAAENGADVDIILLRNLNVEFIGTGKSDDFNLIAKKIIDADAIIF
ncbi:MAG: NAD(P)H-dependent oxidoreductase, partial [Nanoarchaeota archaeon]|nr:NAD(P)H-dependent oxidoreductase [Nanoarchaeota archaeon]